ncbi:cell division inhibition protein DicB [Escherichia coli]|uniref:cell division inhibition protein DicB n=1 Tax=Escherichia coli TaxID=562 RepID=UPI00068006E9|nr:cell division inhibition protein DicB [Escherichia coli]KNF88265.1 cell division inhibition protein DicB [Escherichia coli]
METLLPNVNTSEGCFEIGVITVDKTFIEDAIKQRKLEQDLLNEVCIPSMLARLDLLQKGYKQ